MQLQFLAPVKAVERLQFLTVAELIFFDIQFSCFVRNLASHHRHSDLRTNYKQVGLISALCPARLSFTLEPDNSG